MKTAAEARKESAKNLKEVVQAHSNLILCNAKGKIDEAIKRGRAVACVDVTDYETNAIEGVVLILKELGYFAKKIGPWSTTGQTLIEISWNTNESTTT